MARLTQIKILISDIRHMCTAKGWRDDLPPNPRANAEPYSQYVFPGYLELATSELVEALEAYRDKIWSDTEPPTNPADPNCLGKPIGVGPELADAIIRILDICDIWEVDIESEIERVMAYGWTRPYKHGGRALLWASTTDIYPGKTSIRR